MARQYQTLDGSYVNETGTRQYHSLEGSFINETDGGGGGPNLVGLANASSSSATTGSLTTGIILTAAMSGFATATATLTNGGMNSSANSSSTSTAALTSGITLTSSGISVSSATAALTANALVGFITPQLKNNSGTILASETGVVVNVYNSTTGALVVRKTGLTSDASGYITVRDAVLVAATTYAYEVVLTSLGRRLPTATAS